MKLVYEVENDGYSLYKAHQNDAGCDLLAAEDFRLEAGVITSVSTGLRVLIPSGYVGLILPRSGLSSQGVTVATGVIDPGFTGVLKVAMSVLAGERSFAKGARIAQLVIMPIASLELHESSVKDFKSERGNNGFGSSGI